MKKRILSAIVCFCSLSSFVWAGGYQLSEYSVTNLGRSFAGAGVVGDDFSAIAFNPAGMTLNGSGLQLGGSMIAIRATGKGMLRDATTHAPISSNAPKGKIKTNALLPHFFAQKKINDKVIIGTGVYVPFGLGTYYQKNWFGASHALNSEINAIDWATSVSFKINSKISIGGGVFLEYVEARLTNLTGATESDLNADGWEPGYNLGVLYQPWKDTRFGIAYRSKVAHKVKGPHYFHMLGTTGDCSTNLVFPEHVMLSAYQRVQDFGFSAMARWTRWSRFNTLRIQSGAFPGGVLPEVQENWRNVWLISGGLDYYHNENWIFRAGLAWDQGTVKKPLYRTARVPDNDRWIASVGGSYITGNWQFDVAYAHMFLKTARTYNRNGTTILDAKYSMQINLLGASVQYHF